MAYGDFNDLNRRTAPDKVLCGEAFNIAKTLKYDWYQWWLTSMVYKLLDQDTFGSSIKNKNISNEQLAEELHKPVIKKINKRKVHSPFKDNIWDVDLAEYNW